MGRAYSNTTRFGRTVKRIALIDGDILVYRCGFAAQHTDYYVYDKTEPDIGWIAMFRYKKESTEYIKGSDNYYVVPRLVVEPVGNAIHNVKASIHAIMTNTRSDEYKIFITGKDNFRENIATIRVYKGNRDPNAKPVHYNDIRDYLILQCNASIVDGQEADDAMGIEQCNELREYEYEKLCADNYTEVFANTIICTIDKDLDMIPGWHYNLESKEEYWVDEEEATYNFYYQLLMGDITDNIQGVPGIGKVKAKKILAPCLSEKDMYITVWNVYRDNFEGEDTDIDKIVLENARLLWIRRYENQNWLPPSINLETNNE
jgi:5'-3' exonuclease